MIAADDDGVATVRAHCGEERVDPLDGVGAAVGLGHAVAVEKDEVVTDTVLPDHIEERAHHIVALVEVVEHNGGEAVVLRGWQGEAAQRCADGVAEQFVVGLVDEHLLHAHAVVIPAAALQAVEPDLVLDVKTGLLTGEQCAGAAHMQGVRAVLDPRVDRGVGLEHDRHAGGGKVLQVRRRAEELVGGRLKAHVGVDGAMVRGVGGVDDAAGEEAHRVGIAVLVERYIVDGLRRLVGGKRMRLRIGEELETAGEHFAAPALRRGVQVTGEEKRFGVPVGLAADDVERGDAVGIVEGEMGGGDDVAVILGDDHRAGLLASGQRQPPDAERATLTEQAHAVAAALKVYGGRIIAVHAEIGSVLAQQVVPPRALGHAVHLLDGGHVGRSALDEAHLAGVIDSLVVEL